MRIRKVGTHFLIKHLLRCCSHGYAQYDESCRNRTHFWHNLQKTRLCLTSCMSGSERRIAACCSALFWRDPWDTGKLSKFRSSLNDDKAFGVVWSARRIADTEGGLAMDGVVREVVGRVTRASCCSDSGNTVIGLKRRRKCKNKDSE